VRRPPKRYSRGRKCLKRGRDKREVGPVGVKSFDITNKGEEVVETEMQKESKKGLSRSAHHSSCWPVEPLKREDLRTCNGSSSNATVTAESVAGERTPIPNPGYHRDYLDLTGPRTSRLHQRRS
jgi:hypothetical protein